MNRARRGAFTAGCMIAPGLVPWAPVAALVSGALDALFWKTHAIHGQKGCRLAAGQGSTQRRH